MNNQDVTNIFICVGVIIAFFGVVVALINSIADHKRRKKQATFEFYQDIYKEFVKPLNKLGKNIQKIKSQSMLMTLMQKC